MQGMKPEGAIEEMLAVQMVATHEAAMECLRRAMIDGQTIDGRDMKLKHAAKLVALYERQIAALDRRRGKSSTKCHGEIRACSGGRAGDRRSGVCRWRGAVGKPGSQFTDDAPFETLATNSPEPVGQCIEDDPFAAAPRQGYARS